MIARSVAHISKVVFSPNGSASRDLNRRSHLYGVVFHLPVQQTTLWLKNDTLDVTKLLTKFQPNSIVKDCTISLYKKEAHAQQ